MSGNKDLVERLRLLAAMYPLWGEVKTRSNQAADEIERLRAEVERLRAALDAIQDEAHTVRWNGAASSDVYVRRLDRVWEMAHNALTEEARREQ